jgi:hypothetical protein
MKEDITQIPKSEKDTIIQAISELYNPNSIGQIEKYPPHGEYFVTLYFDTDNYNIKISNRYNHPVIKEPKTVLCNFEISNMNKVGNELTVMIKITRQ